MSRVAKLTQSKYGISRKNANRDTAKNFFMVSIINTHIATITISPRSGDLSPKKIGDQRKLSASCARKNVTAVLIFFLCQPCFHTKKKATPIKKYNSVQTGANIQFGGAKKGLFKVTYQVGIAEIVNGVPNNPTNSQPITEVVSLKKSLMYLEYELNAEASQVQPT